MQMWKIAATAATTGTLLAAPVATALAAPASPVPGTNCTVAQVERAVVDVAPEVIPLVNQLPGGRATAQEILVLPPAQRDARIQEIGRQNPQLAHYYFANQQQINNKIGLVASSCSRY